MTRTRIFALATCLLALTACGTSRPAGNPETAASKPVLSGSFTVSVAIFGAAGSALIVPSAVVPSAETAVRFTDNGGRSWRQLSLPGRPARGSSMAVAGEVIAAVTFDGATLTYQRSIDGGRSWSRFPLRTSEPTDQASVALSVDGRHAAVLASLPGNANNGATPQLFLAQASGALVLRTPPVSGEIGWAGNRLLLAGGPLNSQLYSSSDDGVSWTQRRVGTTVPARFNLDPDTPSIGAPIDAGSGTGSGAVTVPVTEHDGTRASVLFYSSPDGATFTAGVRVPLAGQAGPGVLATVSAAGPEGYVVAEPGSRTLHLVTSDGRQQAIEPAGLPGPVDSLSFADAAHGLASVTSRSCANSKRDCVESTVVLSTADGGRTWQPYSS